MIFFSFITLNSFNLRGGNVNKLDGLFNIEITITFPCISHTYKFLCLFLLFFSFLQSTQFYKVTTENYHKAADQVNAKFK